LILTATHMTVKKKKSFSDSNGEKLTTQRRRRKSFFLEAKRTLGKGGSGKERIISKSSLELEHGGRMWEKGNSKVGTILQAPDAVRGKLAGKGLLDETRGAWRKGGEGLHRRRRKRKGADKEVLCILICTICNWNRGLGFVPHRSKKGGNEQQKRRKD